MSRIGQQEHLKVGDIVCVIDKERGYEYYMQKVTKIYRPSETGSPLVEIQYQAEKDDKLQHKSFSRNELHGKRVFSIPYIGLPYVLVQRYPGYLVFIYFLWNVFSKFCYQYEYWCDLTGYIVLSLEATFVNIHIYL
ncbi:uncharacterized protein LOC102808988 [Saccoglossus kowalevskii]|uniref:Uncharacterized protein LOC102808988 n=1 Tax=Saccoglossus kowalevskii TaxID=10224 RepID=A0ABM0M305_SACKO|nr:PREDICTED: uncharacterized protein LOC102808988 [Saccoglossus kowalevskii]